MICTRCKKLLKAGDEVHALDNEIFCSEECTILSLTDDIIMNAKECAKETYASEATVLTLRDEKVHCKTCSKDLATCSTIWAADGYLYCSSECGIKDFTLHEHDVEHAEAIFNMCAEEINPRDIGIEVQDE